MDISDLDIYNDLDEFQEQEEKKTAEFLQLENKYKESLKANEELKAENKNLRKQQKTLMVNFQNLLDTAKAEIKRKDTQIQQLRKEKDDICFRRKIPNHQNYDKFNPFKSDVETEHLIQPTALSHPKSKVENFPTTEEVEDPPYKKSRQCLQSHDSFTGERHSYSSEDIDASKKDLRREHSDERVKRKHDLHNEKSNSHSSDRYYEKTIRDSRDHNTTSHHRHKSSGDDGERNKNNCEKTVRPSRDKVEKSRDHYERVRHINIRNDGHDKYSSDATVLGTDDKRKISKRDSSPHSDRSHSHSKDINASKRNSAERTERKHNLHHENPSSHSARENDRKYEKSFKDRHDLHRHESDSDVDQRVHVKSVTQKSNDDKDKKEKQVRDSAECSQNRLRHKNVPDDDYVSVLETDVEGKESKRDNKKHHAVKGIHSTAVEKERKGLKFDSYGDKTEKEMRRQHENDYENPSSHNSERANDHKYEKTFKDGHDRNKATHDLHRHESNSDVDQRVHVKSVTQKSNDDTDKKEKHVNDRAECSQNRLQHKNLPDDNHVSVLETDVEGKESKRDNKKHHTEKAIHSTAVEKERKELKFVSHGDKTEKEMRHQHENDRERKKSTSSDIREHVKESKDSHQITKSDSKQSISDNCKNKPNKNASTVEENLIFKEQISSAVEHEKIIQNIAVIDTQPKNPSMTILKEIPLCGAVTSKQLLTNEIDENSNHPTVVDNLNTPKKAALFDKLFGPSPCTQNTENAKLLTNVLQILNCNDSTSTSPSAYSDVNDLEQKNGKSNDGVEQKSQTITSSEVSSYFKANIMQNENNDQATKACKSSFFDNICEEKIFDGIPGIEATKEINNAAIEVHNEAINEQNVDFSVTENAAEVIQKLLLAENLENNINKKVGAKQITGGVELRRIIDENAEVKAIDSCTIIDNDVNESKIVHAQYQDKQHNIDVGHPHEKEQITTEKSILEIDGSGIKQCSDIFDLTEDDGDACVKQHTENIVFELPLAELHEIAKEPTLVVINLVEVDKCLPVANTNDLIVSADTPHKTEVLKDNNDTIDALKSILNKGDFSTETKNSNENFGNQVIAKTNEAVERIEQDLDLDHVVETQFSAAITITSPETVDTNEKQNVTAVSVVIPEIKEKETLKSVLGETKVPNKKPESKHYSECNDIIEIDDDTDIDFTDEEIYFHKVTSDTPSQCKSTTIESENTNKGSKVKKAVIEIIEDIRLPSVLPINQLLNAQKSDDESINTVAAENNSNGADNLQQNTLATIQQSLEIPEEIVTENVEICKASSTINSLTSMDLDTSLISINDSFTIENDTSQEVLLSKNSSEEKHASIKDNRTVDDEDKEPTLSKVCKDAEKSKICTVNLNDEVNTQKVVEKWKTVLVSKKVEKVSEDNTDKESVKIQTEKSAQPLQIDKKEAAEKKSTKTSEIEAIIVSEDSQEVDNIFNKRKSISPKRNEYATPTKTGTALEVAMQQLRELENSSKSSKTSQENGVSFLMSCSTEKYTKKKTPIKTPTKKQTKAKNFVKIDFPKLRKRKLSDTNIDIITPVAKKSKLHKPIECAKTSKSANKSKPAVVATVDLGKNTLTKNLNKKTIKNTQAKKESNTAAVAKPKLIDKLKEQKYDIKPELAKSVDKSATIESVAIAEQENISHKNAIANENSSNDKLPKLPVTKTKINTKQKTLSTKITPKKTDKHVITATPRGRKCKRKNVRRIIDSSSDGDEEIIDNANIIKAKSTEISEQILLNIENVESPQEKQPPMKAKNNNLLYDSPIKSAGDVDQLSPMPTAAHAIFYTDHTHSSTTESTLPQYNMAQDSQYKDIDSRMQTMFQSPPYQADKTEQLISAQFSPTIRMHNDEEDSLNAGSRNNDQPDMTIDETLSTSVASCSSSLETKYISLNNSNYRIEKVSDNVVNVFVTRKRRKKVTK